MLAKHMPHVKKISGEMEQVTCSGAPRPTKGGMIKRVVEHGTIQVT